MNRNSVTPHYQLIQIKIFKKFHGLTDGQPDRHIILPLRVFDPVAYSRMRCAQLRATRFDSQKATQTTRQRGRSTYI